jgi:hypothetical protein
MVTVIEPFSRHESMRVAVVFILKYHLRPALHFYSFLPLESALDAQ